MILSFKQQFKQKILDGSKIHTIREDKPRRWKAGNSIQAATGVRTKNYDCFFEDSCKSTQKIIIEHFPGHVEIFIDGYIFGRAHHHGLNDIYDWSNCIEELAKNDGFDNLRDFFKWFDSDFIGKIIHWTDKTY